MVIKAHSECSYGLQRPLAYVNLVPQVEPVCSQFGKKCPIGAFQMSDFDENDGNQSNRGVLAIQKWSYFFYWTLGSHFFRAHPKRCFLPSSRYAANCKKCPMGTFPMSDFDENDGNQSTRGVLDIQKWSCFFGWKPGSHFFRALPKRCFLPSSRYAAKCKKSTTSGLPDVKQKK